MDAGNLILPLIFWALIFGVITAVIGQKKNYPVGESFLWGALLGIIGLIVVVVRRPRLPIAPPGMRAVKCPRCNAVGNRPETEPRYVCWQCKTAYHVEGMTPENTE